MPTIHNGNFQPVTDNLTRILENGDIRFTESNDTRITDNILFSGAESSIYANPSLIKFTTRVFYKINSIWKQGFFFVKNNGVWQVSSKMYRNINNFWKRIY